MDFKISGLIMFSVGGILLSWAAAHFWSKYGEYKRSTSRRKAFWKGFVVSQAVLMLIGNVVFVGVSWLLTRADTRKDDVDMSICEITERLGLKSGESYLMQVGARTGKTYIVSFNSDGKDTPFELPVKDSEFTTDLPTQPTVAIKLKCKERVSATQVVHLAAPHWLLESGFIMLTQDETGREEPRPDTKNLMKDGLAPLVAKYFDSAEVHLSQELYDSKILG